MGVKLEIVNNYLKITDGSNNPIWFPYRDVRAVIEETDESIQFFNKQANGQVSVKYLYADEPAVGSVTIDTTDATHATGTITLSSAVANTFATNTAQCTSVIAGNTVTINELVYTAVDGARANDTQFSADGTDDNCATDLAAAVNGDTRPGTLGDVSASATTDTVTLTTDVLGIGGDAITLSQTGGTITLGGATFSGGVDADFIIVDGLTYTAIDVSKAGDNTKFDISGSNNADATDLADSIQNDTRNGTVPDNVTASSGAAIVTVVSQSGGTVGNATTLSSSSGSRLAVSGATLTGGLDDASVSGILVDSVEIMSAAVFSGDVPNDLAIAAAANITANSSSPDYNAVAVGARIDITSVVEDTDVNGFVVASTVVKATSTDANMAGATANILDSAGVPFDTWSDLVVWLGKNTGGELIA